MQYIKLIYTYPKFQIYVQAMQCIKKDQLSGITITDISYSIK